MSNKTLMLPDRLYRYLLSVSLRESELLRQLREETAKDPMARMQIAPEQGQFMALLLELLGARRVLEIGVYTGYSALCMASALPPDGRLVACDLSEQWTQVARRYWHAAGLADRIDLRLAPALDTLAALHADGEEASFDFVFVDADKREYRAYFEAALKLLRVGGLVAIDNTLWNGSVVDPDDQSEDTIAIRSFNEHLHRDQRVSLSLVPIGDGLTLARKR